MDLVYTTLIFTLAFVTVLVSLSLRFEAVQARESRRSRLQAQSPDELAPSMAIRRVLTTSTAKVGWREKVWFLEVLEGLLLQAGIYWTVEQFIAFTAALGSSACVIALIVRSDAQTAVAFMLAAGASPYVYLLIRKRQRLNAFVKQLPYALDVIKSTLEAGHTLQRALQVLVGEFAAPLGAEFRLVLEQTRIGISLPKALEDLSTRIPQSDLRMLVIAVKVQTDIGSSLAPIIGHLAELVRARQRLQQQIRTFSVSLRLGGVVVALLPVIVLGIFALTQPSYTNLLFTDPTGLKVLKTAVICDCLAFWMVRRLMKVTY